MLVVTPEPPDPSGVSCPGSVQRAPGAGVDPGHNDGLIRSLSTTGMAGPVVWLITGLPRRDFSPGLTPATTSTIACPVCLPRWPTSIATSSGSTPIAATHSHAIVAAPSGALFDEATFPTTPAGLRRARDWIGRRTGGDLDVVLVAAEGACSYAAT